ncbi:hypothetical protein ACLOJK_012963 [Asimina triloba]
MGTLRADSVPRFSRASLLFEHLSPLRCIAAVYFQAASGRLHVDPKMYEEASQVANDAVSGIRTVASFCAEQKAMDVYKRKCEAPKRNGILG